MTLRFRARHVHATLFDYVQTELVTLGWGDFAVDPAAVVNFGTTPVTYLDFQPEEAGKVIAVNTVAVTLGDEPAARDWELGAGLLQLKLPLFVDVYGENQSIAQSIASDVKDILEDVYLAVKDWTAGPPGVDTADQIELDKDDLSVERPQVALTATDIKRHWRVVKTFAGVYYIGG